MACEQELLVAFSSNTSQRELQQQLKRRSKAGQKRSGISETSQMLDEYTWIYAALDLHKPL